MTRNSIQTGKVFEKLERIIIDAEKFADEDNVAKGKVEARDELATCDQASRSLEDQLSDKKRLGGKLANTKQEQEGDAVGGNGMTSVLCDGVPSVDIYVANPTDLRKHAYLRDDELAPDSQPLDDALLDMLLPTGPQDDGSDDGLAPGIQLLALGNALLVLLLLLGLHDDSLIVKPSSPLNTRIVGVVTNDHPYTGQSFMSRAIYCRFKFEVQPHPDDGDRVGIAPAALWSHGPAVTAASCHGQDIASSSPQSSLITRHDSPPPIGGCFAHFLPGLYSGPWLYRGYTHCGLCTFSVFFTPLGM